MPFFFCSNSDKNDCAHVRYRPQDYLSVKCKQLLQAQDSEKKKIAAYTKVMENFKPVFHHFFLENFTQPAEWFEKRISYTRSMASNSVVGKSTSFSLP